ncbi:epoxyqueuosine reductase QueH, partial [Stenotrophomonas sp. P5_B8]
MPTVTPLDRPTLSLPDGHTRLLLHSCCAPCSGEVMEAITASGIDYTIFFYNPNIHPAREYELRKQENIRFAEKHGVPFVDADYDTDHWFARARGMENAPERGIRCTMCF